MKIKQFFFFSCTLFLASLLQATRPEISTVSFSEEDSQRKAKLTQVTTYCEDCHYRIPYDDYSLEIAEDGRVISAFSSCQINFADEVLSHFVISCDQENQQFQVFGELSFNGTGGKMWWYGIWHHNDKLIKFNFDAGQYQ